MRGTLLDGELDRPLHEPIPKQPSPALSKACAVAWLWDQINDDGSLSSRAPWLGRRQSAVNAGNPRRVPNETAERAGFSIPAPSRCRSRRRPVALWGLAKPWLGSHACGNAHTRRSSGLGKPGECKDWAANCAAAVLSGNRAATIARESSDSARTQARAQLLPSVVCDTHECPRPLPQRAFEDMRLVDVASAVESRGPWKAELPTSGVS